MGSAAKVGGAVNLYRLLPELEHVVLFSSLVSAIPLPGQASYAASNAVLDALASAWRSRGAKAVSLSWGIWQDTGVVADPRNAGYQRLMMETGFAPMLPATACSLFSWSAGSSAHHLVLTPIDWSEAGRAVRGRPGSRFFDEVLAADPVALDVEGFREEVRALGADRLVAHLRTLTGRILQVGPDDVVATTPLGRQGIDSLMAMELRYHLELDLGLKLPASLVWNYPTLVTLADHLLERLNGSAPGKNGASPAPGSVDPDASAELVKEISARSDQDVLRELLGGGR